MTTAAKIAPGDLPQSIEDAILFGHIAELDAVLELIKDDQNFPDDLRYGIESLRYFREYYGKSGALEPSQWLQKQKIAVMESAFGSHLLDLLRQNEIFAYKQA